MGAGRAVPGRRRAPLARTAGDTANDPAQAALALLEFHPDDVAEPLPDTADLQAVTWSIKDNDAVLEALEDDDSWQCLGQSMPDGSAYAWPDRTESGAIDLGGWRAQPGEAEAARLIVRAARITLLGTHPRLLRGIASHLQASLGELIAARDELAA